MYKYAFLCLLFISAAAFSQSRLTTRLDSLFHASPSDEPGFAVSIEKKGSILYRNVTGLADKTTAMPLDTASNFRMASVSKQFTAMGIFLLEKAGVLSFDDPLSRWLPELPAHIGHTVLIRHLLTHTSGLPDYEWLIPDSQTRQVLDADVLQLLSTHDSTYFPPGARFRYSNSGFCLLALIIERASHQSFAAFIREKIFSPLHMDHSIVYEDGHPIEDRAMGYARDSTGHIYPSDQSVTSATKGDGGVYTSIVDYSKWMQALQKGSLLRLPPILRRLRVPVADMPDSAKTDRRSVVRRTDMRSFRKTGYISPDTRFPDYYAGGWFITDASPPILFHSGSTCGFANFVVQLPGDEWSIVYFSNLAGNTAPFRAMVRILQEEGVADLSTVFQLHKLTD